MFHFVRILFCFFTIPCLGTTIESLSLEEKVGQLLITQFHGEIANEDARVLIQEIKVGGINYYNWSNGLNSPLQVQCLSASLQELTLKNKTAIPLLITIDQEGGLVARLTNGFTVFPGNKALGEAGDSDLAEAAAFAMGQELYAVGVNMNFAPVVDVNSNPRNPIIGIRSFGDNPEEVSAFGKKALRGYSKAHVLTTLKHFPGHGDVAVDSHEDLPVVNKSLEELERVELLPFMRLGSSADAIMTAHILVPALDPENCSTLSEKTLSYLRNTIGFQGVIITDSLVMEGVLKKCHTVDEAAIQALNAGCDILLLGGRQLVGGHTTLELSVSDVQRIHGSIVNAVKSGRISEERLNQAVTRILKLKERYLDHKTFEAEPINAAANRAIAKKIASLALKIIEKDTSLIQSLHEKKIVVFAPQLLRDSVQQTTLLERGKTTDAYFFENLSPSVEEIAKAIARVQDADVLFFCSYNAWKNPSQIALIQSLLDTDKSMVLIATRDPLDASLISRTDLIFKTFSPTAVSIEAVCFSIETLDLYESKSCNFSSENCR